jgi:hypothetical protein
MSCVLFFFVVWEKSSHSLVMNVKLIKHVSIWTCGLGDLQLTVSDSNGPFVSGHTQIVYMHQQEIPNSLLKSPRFLSYVAAHSWKMRKGKKVIILIILHEHDVWCKPSTNNQEQSGSIFWTPCDPSLALLGSTCFPKVPPMDFTVLLTAAQCCHCWGLPKP